MQTQTQKHAKAILAEIKNLHTTKGWHAVYAYLNFAKVDCHIREIEFGWDGKATRAQKNAWMKEEKPMTYRGHLYSAGRGMGNIIRGQEIVLF